jgi:hypothetical protein
LSQHSVIVVATGIGCEYVHQSLPRLLTLWLDKYGYFKSKVHGSDKKVPCADVRVV